MFHTIGLLFVIGMLAIVSPGPDFFLILKNASLYDRRAALATVAGITIGIMIHISYCIMGIGILISKSILLYSLIKYAGAAYLIYIGFKSLQSRPRALAGVATNGESQSASVRRAFMEGLICNVTNPKVTLLMLSVFTQVISPQTPALEQIVYGSVFVVQTIVYWSLLVLVIQRKEVQNLLGRIQHQIDPAFGGILIALGLKVAMSD
jgi:RhtB (resistance to homoserine/threonine) family protein